MRYTCSCVPGSPFHWREQTHDTGMAIATMRQAEANERFVQPLLPATKPARKKKTTAMHSVAKLLREATILANRHGGQYSKARG